MLLLPLLLKAQTFHLLIFADTEDFRFSSVMQSAQNYFQRDFAEKIRRNCGYNVNVVLPESFDVNTLERKIENLRSSSSDVILFYYCGHGYNSNNEQFPFLYFKGNSISQYSVFYLLKRRPHKTLIVMADAGNAIFDNSKGKTNIVIDDEDSPINEPIVSKGEDNYLVSSSKRGQRSYFSENLGFFTRSFKEAFEDEIRSSGCNLSWDRIFRNTTSKTERLANENGEEQTPQWIKE